MKLNIYQIDAFTDQLFKGNPAAIIPLDNWLPDETMQAIAAENNLAETAFTIPKGADFELRWFTPTIEVALCGHATLACAYVFFNELGYDKNNIHFHTKSGKLSVLKDGNDLIMDFPADELKAVEAPKQIFQGLGIDETSAVFRGRDDYMVVLDSQATIEQLQPDFRILSQLKSRGLIATALGEETDFVSRCFFPQSGVDEDPVTGSAHTTLTPYWAKKLNKSTLTAKQLSTRTGNLVCSLKGDRVLLKGQAVLYMKGELTRLNFSDKDHF